MIFKPPPPIPLLAKEGAFNWCSFLNGKKHMQTLSYNERSINPAFLLEKEGATTRPLLTKEGVWGW